MVSVATASPSPRRNREVAEGRSDDDEGCGATAVTTGGVQLQEAGPVAYPGTPGGPKVQYVYGRVE
jgi:hypothetical protein